MPRVRRRSSRANPGAFSQQQPLEWELRRGPPGGKFRSPDGTAIPDTIDLTGLEYGPVLAGVPIDRRPASLHVRRFNPEVLDVLSRTQRLTLLQCLADETISLCLWMRTRVGGKEVYRRATPRGRVTVDLATVLILSVALRGDENMPLVGELIGLSKPSTIVLLANHRWPPLRGSLMVAKLAHAAARNITQGRMRGALHGSLSLYEHVPQFIAFQLEGLKEDDILPLNRTLRRLAANGTAGQDRGIQLGLVLKGVRLCLRNAMTRETLNWKRFGVLIQAILGGLSGGFNPAAPAVLAIKPLMERFVGRRIEDREGKFKMLWGKVWNGFRDEIETRMRRTTQQERASFEEYTRALNGVMRARTPPL